MVREKIKSWQKLNFNVQVRPLTIVTEKAGEKVKDFWISGDAINETVTRNNYRYTGEELGKAAHTFIGRPLLTDHEALIKNVIGIVEEAEFREGAIKFKARIPNIPATEEIRSKIDAGILNNVSIGAKVDDLIESADGIMTVQGLEFLELSLVPIPGDANATIGHALAESYKTKVGENMNEDLVKRIEDLEKRLGELTKTPVKEEGEMPPMPPAQAPAPAQPVIAPAVVVEPTQDGQVAASPAQAEAPAQPEAPMPPAESMADMVAKEVAKLMKTKSVTETTKVAEKITKTGNLTITEEENGKKFIVERASNGKVRFWRE